MELAGEIGIKGKCSCSYSHGSWATVFQWVLLVGVTPKIGVQYHLVLVSFFDCGQESMLASLKGNRYFQEFLERLENWAWLLLSQFQNSQEKWPTTSLDCSSESSLPLPSTTPWTRGMDSQISSKAQPGNSGASLTVLARSDLSLSSGTRLTFVISAS